MMKNFLLLDGSKGKVFFFFLSSVSTFEFADFAYISLPASCIKSPIFVGVQLCCQDELYDDELQVFLGGPKSPFSS